MIWHLVFAKLRRPFTEKPVSLMLSTIPLRNLSYTSCLTRSALNANTMIVSSVADYFCELQVYQYKIF